MCIMKQPLCPWNFTFRHSEWQQLKLVSLNFFRAIQKCQLTVFTFHLNPESTQLGSSTEWTYDFFPGSLLTISATETGEWPVELLRFFIGKVPFLARKLIWKENPELRSKLEVVCFQIGNVTKVVSELCKHWFDTENETSAAGSIGGVSTLQNKFPAWRRSLMKFWEFTRAI